MLYFRQLFSQIPEVQLALNLCSLNGRSLQPRCLETRLCKSTDELLGPSPVTANIGSCATGLSPWPFPEKGNKALARADVQSASKEFVCLAPGNAGNWQRPAGCGRILRIVIQHQLLNGVCCTAKNEGGWRLRTCNLRLQNMCLIGISHTYGLRHADSIWPPRMERWEREHAGADSTSRNHT